MTNLLRRRLKPFLWLFGFILAVPVVPFSAFGQPALQLYCNALEVQPGATPQDVRRAFKAKAKGVGVGGHLSAADSERMRFLVEAFHALGKGVGDADCRKDNPEVRLDLRALSDLVKLNKFDPKQPLLAIFKNFYSSEGELYKVSDFTNRVGLPNNVQVKSFLGAELMRQTEEAWLGLTGSTLDNFPGWRSTILTEFRQIWWGESLGQILARILTLGLPSEKETQISQEILRTLRQLCGSNSVCWQTQSFKFFKIVSALPTEEIAQLEPKTKAVVAGELTPFLLSLPGEDRNISVFDEINQLHAALLSNLARQGYGRCQRALSPSVPQSLHTKL